MCIVTNICNNSYIWLNTVRNHFSSTKSYFFLNRVHNVQTKWQLNFLLFQYTSYFSDHESTHAVIQRATHVAVIIQHHKFIFKRYYASDVYSKFFNLFIRATSTIQKDIFQTWCFLFLLTHMNGWPTKNRFYNSFIRMYIYAFRWCNHVI